MLDAMSYVVDGEAPAFVVTAYGTRAPFCIDNNAFTRWVAEVDELALTLPDPDDEAPGSTLSDLVYLAQSADVLVGDPGIELNVHGHADGAGFSVRLNNRVGRQTFVGLTRGRHELHWSPNGLTPAEEARHYLQEICDIANSVLADL